MRKFALLFAVCCVFLTFFYIHRVLEHKWRQNMTFLSSGTGLQTQRHTNKREIGLNLNAQNSEASAYLVVLVFSNRDSFERRKAILETWASGRKNVYFIVATRFCAYPPEQRTSGTCQSNNKTVPERRLNEYERREDEITARLRNETSVVLVPIMDDSRQFPSKLKFAYKWALAQTTAKWILKIDDDSVVRIDGLETYLKSQENPDDNVIIGSIIWNGSKEEDGKWSDKHATYPPFPLRSSGFIVSRPIAQCISENMGSLFEYQRDDTSVGIWINESSLKNSVKLVNTKRMVYKGSCTDTSKLVIGQGVSPAQMHSCFAHHHVRQDTVRAALEIQCRKSVPENPSKYLHSGRFDVIVKMVYVYYYAIEGTVPDAIEHIYTEHERAWNGFHEQCSSSRTWCDSLRPCTPKNTKAEFLASFQRTIKSIQGGFDSSLSQIPVTTSGYILNGAHRLAAAIVLSQNATFQHLKSPGTINWGFTYFRNRGLSTHLADLAMLEWMKIQQKMTSINPTVSIVSLFSNDHVKESQIRDIVRKQCSRDGGILYEKAVNVTKHGITELIKHMYGKQPWLETKIAQMLSKFWSSYYLVHFLFFFGKRAEDLNKCKHDIRKLYNDKYFKSSAHIPDSPEENMILAEMILNPNSIQFMNYANNSLECRSIAQEIATRSSVKSINTLPGIYLGRQDIMIDSGAVMSFFNLRKLTDVDILYLNNIDKDILGTKRGMTFQDHAFKSNLASNGRAWGEDHFSNTVKTKWDLFYDANNYGYCYGIKFVSLKQLIRYKTKRNEPNKDQRDVDLVNAFIKTI